MVGGDVVAVGEQPAETLERLRALGDRVVWVRGNTDRELTPGEAGLAPSALVEATRHRLSEEQIAFLHELPPTVQIGRVLYVHASPRNDMDIFTEETPEERIAFLFEDVDADVVVCGHTHTQFERVVAGRRVVNSGSVGVAVRGGAGRLLDARSRPPAHALRRGDARTIARRGRRVVHRAWALTSSRSAASASRTASTARSSSKARASARRRSRRARPSTSTARRPRSSARGAEPAAAR